MSLVLAGDIGGTHTRLALAEVDGDGVSLIRLQYFDNAGVADLAEPLERFLSGRFQPRAACLAVAGPTDGRRARLTNLPWIIEADALAARFGLPRVRLVNDFVAVGHGLAALGPEGLAPLQVGDPSSDAPRVALGAGTGLGVVQCVRRAEGYEPIPSEGGHIAFAPLDERQDRLLAWLRQRHGRVSVERILSGPGLAALYGFCWADTGLPGPAPALDPAQVSAAALAGDDGAARAAVDLFCRVLGQVAGDLALLAQARGGVYLAGGIAPRILPLLTRGDGREFLDGFTAKGRFSDWMTRVPVKVVLDEGVGLKGAAVAAAALVSETG